MQLTLLRPKTYSSEVSGYASLNKIGEIKTSQIYWPARIIRTKISVTVNWQGFDKKFAHLGILFPKPFLQVPKNWKDLKDDFSMQAKSYIFAEAEFYGVNIAAVA